MFKIFKSSVMPVICMGFVALLAPSLSYARGRDHHKDHHYFRYHERPSFGLHLTFVPDDAFVVKTSPARYYYYDGLYYTKIGGNFVHVPPPIGAVVTAIPPEFKPVVINGITYYTDNGIYYIYTRYGYQVVPQPVTALPAQTVVTQPVPAAATAGVQTELPATVTTATEESFTVNIPNDKGGFTPVMIKRSGAGFVGPQGEFYAEFPKVAQLQAMYGK